MTRWFHSFSQNGGHELRIPFQCRTPYVYSFVCAFRANPQRNTKSSGAEEGEKYTYRAESKGPRSRDLEDMGWSSIFDARCYGPDGFLQMSTLIRMVHME